MSGGCVGRFAMSHLADSNPFEAVIHHVLCRSERSHFCQSRSELHPVIRCGKTSDRAVD